MDTSLGENSAPGTPVESSGMIAGVEKDAYVADVKDEDKDLAGDVVREFLFSFARALDPS